MVEMLLQCLIQVGIIFKFFHLPFDLSLREKHFVFSGLNHFVKQRAQEWPESFVQLKIKKKMILTKNLSHRHCRLA